MNASNSRALSAHCESCISKMQGVAELLLLSCNVRPVTAVSTKHLIEDNLHNTISSRLRSLSTLSESLVSQVYMVSSKWMSICDTIQDLSTAVVHIIEMISHVAYLISVNFPMCSPFKPGLIDKYSVWYSGLEIKISCTRLKRTRLDELSPQIIIDLCSNISKHIAVITDICRTTAQNIKDESLEDQFKLSIKSVTCAAGCLIASIKAYRSSPNLTYHSRVMLFCEPVLASSQALVSFATERDFIGDEGVLSPQAKDAQKRILGACMNIVSACIQLCKTVRDLTYDLMTSHHKDKMKTCLESINQGSRKLVKLIDEYDIDKFLKNYQSNYDLSKGQSSPDSTNLSTLSLNVSTSPNISPIDSRSLVESLENNHISSTHSDNDSKSNSHSNDLVQGHLHSDTNSSHGDQSDHSTSFSGSENSVASR